VGDRISLILAGLALVFLIGVAYAGKTMPQRPPRSEYTLSVESVAKDGAVEARGTTNLPDGARLAVIVDRLYRLKGTHLWRAARVGEGVAVVEGGRWSITIPVSDEEWVREVQDRVNRKEIDPVAAVQGSLRTTVVFSPLIEQDPSVRSALGPDGAGLAASNAATRVGSYWIIRGDATAEMPLHLEYERALLAGLR